MANRIEKALQEKNRGNQSEMARYVGVSPQAVQKWIAGASEPRGNNLKKAAEFLGLSEVYLKFGGPQATYSHLERQAQERPGPAYAVEEARSEQCSPLDMHNLKDAISAAIEIDRKGNLNLPPEKMAVLIAYWYDEWCEKGPRKPSLTEANRILRLVA